MLADRTQIARMQSLWAGVIQQAIIDEWEQLRSLKRICKGERAEAVANRTAAARRYFASAWFVTICDFAGLTHSLALVDGIMALVCADARPSFAMDVATKEDAA